MLEEFHKHDIPIMVWLCPILPFINDTEENIRAILEECIRIGVTGIVCFDMGMSLREGDREYYYAELDKHFPRLKQRYIRTYGNAYQLPSPYNQTLMKLFHRIFRENQIISRPEECFRYLSVYPERYEQMSFLEDKC